MRLLIDLQGAQTEGSRSRGIGRYSVALSRKLLEIAPTKNHTVHILMNAAFPEAALQIRAKVAGLIAPEAIHVWKPPAGSKGIAAPADYNRVGAAVRDAVIDAIAPDAILILSLFEGFGDEALALVSSQAGAPFTAVVLYDLIPYIQHERYLSNDQLARFYYGRIHQLRRANLCLAISESARQEALDYLHLPEDDVVAISTAADDVFSPRKLSSQQVGDLRSRYGLRPKLVMYTGGIDGRKNIDALIRAYALLPLAVRYDATLAIVCAATRDQREALREVGRSHGLEDADLRITGFVPEADLISLYVSCAVFVFPSLHEGFGLPALEAMACGAAVIGSDRSSIPEVIGLPEALFDPEDDAAIAAKIEVVLTDEAFAARLRDHSLKQAARFSWHITAERALEAITRKVQESQLCTPAIASRSRPKLAFVSPLPPQRSGIAVYAAELIPELARYYEMDFVCDPEAIGSAEMRGIGRMLSPAEFLQAAGHYDRVLYQFGNSNLHAFMPDLAARVPGTITLHDWTLSGMANVKDVTPGGAGYWISRLRDEHGYLASAQRLVVRNNAQHKALQDRYPCNIDAIRYSTKLIVHSDFMKQAIEASYGFEAATRTFVVPLLRSPRPRGDRQAARKRLGFSARDFVVCSFGGVAATKLHDLLLEAWFASSFANDITCRLVFVGASDDPEFDRRIRRMIAVGDGGERVLITGYTSPESYSDFLLAADVAVQLRAENRSETSSAVVDALAEAVPLIVSSGGAFREVPDAIALKLPSTPIRQELIDAIIWMRAHLDERLQKASMGRNHILATATPRRVAELYRDAIEAPALGVVAIRERLIGDLQISGFGQTLAKNPAEIAHSVSRSLPLPKIMNRVLIDITGLDDSTASGQFVQSVVSDLLKKPIAGFAAEPFYLCDGGRAFLAREYTYGLLGHPGSGQIDEEFHGLKGDVCVTFFTAGLSDSNEYRTYEDFGVWGVPVVVLCTETMLRSAETRAGSISNLLERVAQSASLVLVETAQSDDRLMRLLDEVYAPRFSKLPIAVRRMDAQFDLRQILELVQSPLLDFEHKAWSSRQRYIGRPDHSLVCTGVGLLEEATLRTNGVGGHLVYGPYVALVAGRYELRIFANVLKLGSASVEVSTQEAGVVASATLIQPLKVHDPALTTQFLLPLGAGKIEVRLSVTATSNIIFKYYELIFLET